MPKKQNSQDNAQITPAQPTQKQLKAFEKMKVDFLKEINDTQKKLNLVLK